MNETSSVVGACNTLVTVFSYFQTRQPDESRKHTNNLPLMPVNAAFITSVEPVAQGAVPRSK